MDSTYKPLILPDEYLIELEGLLDLCLVKLLGLKYDDSRSQIVFQHMAFPMKLDILGALISELLPGYPHLSEYPKAVELLKKAQEKRNMISHAIWGIDQGSKQVQIARVTARGKLKYSMRPIPVSEIREVGNLLVEAAQAVTFLVLNKAATNKPPQSGQ